MHPDSARLMEFCDAESAPRRERRIAAHLAKCAKCARAVEAIRQERGALSAAAAATETGPDADGLSLLVTAWRDGHNSRAACQLRERLREQIETYCGSNALGHLDHPEMPVEEMLGRTGEILRAFLGPEAAAAAQDDLFSELAFTPGIPEARA